MTTRPIRVLHTITGMRIGGAERLVAAAALGLPRERFASGVCCLAERGPLADTVEEAGVPLWSVGRFPGLRDPLAFWQLVRIIRSFRPHIVHTHLQSANLYGRLAARLAGVPVIVSTEHNVYAGKHQRYILGERQLARWTDALIAVSEEVRRSLAAQLRVDAQAIRLIYNGVPMRDASPNGVAAIRSRLSSGAEAVLGTVASLTPKKGLDQLVRALALLKSRQRRVTLVVAGDGTERERLQQLACRLEVSDRIVWLGAVDRVEDVLGAIDIFVLPSLIEGLPLALLEAMGAGLPVIATRVGGVPEVVVNDSNGLLVNAGTAEPLADAIERLAAAPELRKALGERARDTIARHFTERRYLEDLERLYVELQTSGVRTANPLRRRRT